MSNITTTGLAAVMVGAIAGDGGMGTSLAVIGYTAEGSVALNTDDPTLTAFYAEEVDDPIFQSSKKGKRALTLDLGFPDLVQIQKVMGGTITGSGDTEEWKAPDQIPTIEFSVKLVPNNGYVMNIPRASFSAKFKDGYVKTTQLKVTVVMTILQPTKTGEPSLFLTKLEAE